MNISNIGNLRFLQNVLERCHSPSGDFPYLQNRPTTRLNGQPSRRLASLVLTRLVQDSRNFGHNY